MKTRSRFFFIALSMLLFSVVVQSCKKTPAPTTSTPPTASVPSFSFIALGITTTGVQYTVTNTMPSGPLQITASNAANNSNYQTVQITLNNAVTSPGTFTLSPSLSNTGLYTSGSNTIKYSTNATNVGTITITKVDMVNNLMSASYNFVAQQYSPTIGNSGTISGSFTNVGF